MSDLAEKYNAAIKLGKKYRDLPRAGWAKKGSRAMANQTIEVPRVEAERLADDLATSKYVSYVGLYETMTLRKYMAQLAEGKPDAETCPKCHYAFLPGWMNGRCPYCAATEAAKKETTEMLEGAGK